MLNDRLAGLKDYPFQRLRALLDGHAPGRPAINLSIGEPQHAYPAFVTEILAENGHLYGKYPPQLGSDDLRQAIADWLVQRFGLGAGTVDPDKHIVALNGTREGLYMVAQAAVPSAKAGLKPLVLLPNPFYQVYAGAALSAGADIGYLPALAENNFQPDLDAVDEATWARTAMLYLCSPANPQGTVAGLDYLVKALELARRHDFLLVCDECYAEIWIDQAPPGGLQAAAALGEGFANVVVFHSLSKRSSVPGLRSGFIAGDANVIALFARLRSYGGSPLSLPACAASAALWRDETHVEANRALYRAKFDAAQAVLGNRLGFYRPAGGFYLWLDVGDSEAACLKLWHESGVRTLPGKYLVRETGAAADAAAGVPYLRVALVDTLDNTREAIARIRDTLT